MLGRTGMLFGPAGQGKSTLMMTAPGPRLVLDAEFKAGDLPGKLVEFNLKGSKVPDMDEDTTLVAFIRDISDVARAVSWLKSGKLPVKTTWLDSITALQQSAVDGPPFNGDMDRQKWGTLLKLFRPHISELLKIAKDPATALELAVLIAWDAEKFLEGEVVGTKPWINGQLAGTIKHLTDFVWYSTLEQKGTELVHKLQLMPTGTIAAKTGMHGLEGHHGFVKNPNLTTLLSEVKNKGNK